MYFVTSFFKDVFLYLWLRRVSIAVRVLCVEVIMEGLLYSGGAWAPSPPFPAGHHPCRAPGGVVSGVPLTPDLAATFLRGWARGSGPPHPTRLYPWRRLRLPSSRPRTSRRGSSGRVSPAVRRDLWRLPAAGPLARASGKVLAVSPASPSSPQ